MSMFGSAVAGSATGMVNRAAAKATVWTTCWPLWAHFDGNTNPYEADPSCAVPIVWLRHDRSLGLMRGAACVFCNDIEL